MMFEWLAIMPSWEFWLLATLGIIAIGVNLYAFWLSFKARMMSDEMIEALYGDRAGEETDGSDEGKE